MPAEKSATKKKIEEQESAIVRRVALRLHGGPRQRYAAQRASIHSRARRLQPGRSGAVNLGFPGRRGKIRCPGRGVPRKNRAMRLRSTPALRHVPRTIAALAVGAYHRASTFANRATASHGQVPRPRGRPPHSLRSHVHLGRPVQPAAAVRRETSPPGPAEAKHPVCPSEMVPRSGMRLRSTRTAAAPGPAPNRRVAEDSDQLSCNPRFFPAQQRSRAHKHGQSGHDPNVGRVTRLRITSLSWCRARACA